VLFSNVFQLELNGNGYSTGIHNRQDAPQQYDFINYDIQVSDQDHSGPTLSIEADGSSLTYSNITMVRSNLLTADHTESDRLSLPLEETLETKVRCQLFDDTSTFYPANGETANTVANYWNCYGAPGSTKPGFSFSLALDGRGALRMGNDAVDPIVTWVPTVDGLQLSTSSGKNLHIFDIERWSPDTFASEVYIDNNRYTPSVCEIVLL